MQCNCNWAHNHNHSQKIWCNHNHNHNHGAVICPNPGMNIQNTRNAVFLQLAKMFVVHVSMAFLEGRVSL